MQWAYPPHHHPPRPSQQQPATATLLMSCIMLRELPNHDKLQCNNHKPTLFSAAKKERTAFLQSSGWKVGSFSVRTLSQLSPWPIIISSIVHKLVVATLTILTARGENLALVRQQSDDNNLDEMDERHGSVTNTTKGIKMM